MGDNFARVVCVGEPKNERCYLDAHYDGANFYNMDGANGHNEGQVGVMCNRYDLFNDTVDIKATWGYFQGELTSSHISVSVNSEAYTRLWNDGTTSFVYDFRTKHWTMYAKVGGKEWKFCSPEGAIDNILAALECFSRDDTIADKNAKRIALDYATAFKNDKTHITSTAKIYSERNDCNMEVYRVEEPPVFYDF